MSVTVPLLLAAASDSEAEIVAAARQAMVALRGDGIDVAVKAASARPKVRFAAVLIDVVGQRRQVGGHGTGAPGQRPGRTDTSGRTALGQVIDPTQLPVLLASLSPADAEERTTVQQGFARSAARGDQDACARQLQAALPQLDRDTSRS